VDGKKRIKCEDENLHQVRVLENEAGATFEVNNTIPPIWK
jgi:hypothetical protein